MSNEHMLLGRMECQIKGVEEFCACFLAALRIWSRGFKNLSLVRQTGYRIEASGLGMVMNDIHTMSEAEVDYSVH